MCAFANPGTSEMRFVAALDRVEGMRCVLGLFEGVVTGAADGYATGTTNGGLLWDHAFQAWSDQLATRLQELGARRG